MLKFIVPFYYTIFSRLKSNLERISWLIIYLIPIYIIEIVYSDINIVFLSFIYLVSISIFISVYEIGYIENDIKTTLIEKKPTIRITQEDFDFAQQNYNSIVRIKLIIILVLLFILLYMDYSDSAAIYSLQFIIFLIFTRIFFYIHNAIRNRLNIITFASLAVFKYWSPIVLFISIENSLYPLILAFLIFPLLRIIEQATHKRYNLLKFSASIGNHDLFRIKYYGVLLLSYSLLYLSGFIKELSTLGFFLIFYFFVYRLISYFFVKKNIYIRVQ